MATVAIPSVSARSRIPLSPVTTVALEPVRLSEFVRCLQDLPVGVRRTHPRARLDKDLYHAHGCSVVPLRAPPAPTSA
jgi:hypothetical protein